MAIKKTFALPTLELARKLIGMKLVRKIGKKTISGMIVETEAYGTFLPGVKDEACHGHRGKTARTEVMFRSPGHCYVYLIYGMHSCINVVSEAEGTCAAVLIRAIEPIDGRDEMQKRRKTKASDYKNLTNGPGKLCQALGITTKLSGLHFESSDEIAIEPHRKFSNEKIAASTRIGISKAKDLPWRFYLKESEFVSKI